MLKIIFRFGLIITALLVLFELSKASLFVPELSSDLILALSGGVFVGLGIYVGLKVRKERIVEVAAPIEVNEEQIKILGLSEREMEVLKLIADGCSNKEVGSDFFFPRVQSKPMYLIFL